MRLRDRQLPIISAISVIIILLNTLPFLHRLFSTPPDRVFLGSQFYTLDFNIYLGHFKEGAEGVFKIHDKHTSEPHAGFFLRREYWLWGFLTGFLLKLPIWAVYHSARVVAGLTLLSLIYFLICKVFSREKSNLSTIHSLSSIPTLRLATFILATLVAGFPKYTLDPTTGKKSLDLFLYWFVELDASARFATLFHYLIGNILLLSFIIISAKLFTQKINFKNKSFIFNLLFLILTGYLSGIIHPSTLATIYLMIPIYLLLKFLLPEVEKQFSLLHNLSSKFSPGSTFPRQLLLLSLFTLATLPVLPFLRAQTGTFPWTEIAKWDRASIPSIDFREYIMAIGPIFYLGTIGIAIFVFKHFFNTAISTILFLRKFTQAAGTLLSKSKFSSWLANIHITPSVNDAKSGESRQLTDTILLLLLSFILSTFLWTFKLFPLLPDINRLRFMQVPIFVPFAIFSTIALATISNTLIRVSKMFRAFKKDSGQKISNFLLASSVLGLLYITFPAYRWGIYREYYMFPPGDFLIHAPKSLYQAYTWLDKNTRPDQVVLSSFYSATLIPGQTGNTSYWGHPWSTVNFYEKAALAEKFFRSQMTVDEARQFLKDGHISFFLDDFQVRTYTGDLSKYSSLMTPVFNNPEAAIYQFQP